MAAVVFLPGCNFGCPYCHNRVLAQTPEELPEVALDEVLVSVCGRPEWIDGVVVSGGEPTLHDGLPELCARFRNAGLEVKLDTNGSRPEALHRLLAGELVQAVALDVKAPLEPAAYGRAIGGPPDLAAVRRSLDLALAASQELEVRVTVVPGWHSEADLVAIGRLAAGADRFTLQRYRPPDPVPASLAGVAPADSDSFRDLRERVMRELGR